MIDNCNERTHTQYFLVESGKQGTHTQMYTGAVQGLKNL